MHRSNSVLSAAVTAVLGGVSASSAFAQLAPGTAIGVNFTDVRSAPDENVRDDAPDALASGETAGAAPYAHSNWNNYGRWGNFDAAVKDNAGANLPSVRMAWDSGNTWGVGIGGSPNHKLMNGYIDSNGQANIPVESPYDFYQNSKTAQEANNDPTVYVTGLSAWLAAVGATSYGVVLYVDGDAAEGRTGEYWLQAATGADTNGLTVGADLTSHVFVRDDANFDGAFTQVPLTANSAANAAAGNYAVFAGLTADGFLIRTEETSSPSAFRSPINGFQIIAVVPEPASLSLLALGALPLLRRRRR